MHRRAFTASALAALAAACTPRAPAPAASATPEPTGAPPLQPIRDPIALRAALELTRATANLPALAGCILRPGADDEWVAVTGVRQQGAPDAVRIDDPWHIGSDTKAMTAALYARLVDQGKLKWAATVAELFPGLTVHEAWRAMPVEHLLGHISGAADLSADWLVARRADRRPLDVQRMETARTTLAAPPANQPGRFAYANLNYLLIGAAIEKATGKTWEQAIQANVFDPLHMDGAGFGPPTGATPRGHRTDQGGRLIPMGDGPEADNPAALAPAAGVHLPLGSWARFARVFLDPQQTFLKPETLQHLVAPISRDPEYACGWGILESPNLGRSLAHGGSNTMWYATALISPERGLAVLLASNCATRTGINALEQLAPNLLQAAI